MGLIQGITPFKVKAEGFIEMSYGIDPQGYTFRLGEFKSGTAYNTIDHKGNIILHPREGGVAVSDETFVLPDNLMALFRGKSSYTRRGILFSTATVDAGYKGRLEFWVFNGGHQPITLYMSQGIAQINFFELTEAAHKSYEGLY